MRRKIFGCTVLVLLVMSVFSGVAQAGYTNAENVTEGKEEKVISAFAEKSAPKATLTRTPVEVCSMQPALIFASVANGYHNVTLNVNFTISAYTNFYPSAFIHLISMNLSSLRIAFDGYGEDRDGDIIEYEWRSSINGLLSNSQSFSIGLASLTRGETHTISFKVKDSDGVWSKEATRKIRVPSGDDSGNSSSEASDIDFNVVWYEWINRGLVKPEEDYFRIYLTSGRSISLYLDVPRGKNFDLYFYDPNENLVASSTNGWGENESMSYQATVSGYHYIKISGPTRVGNYGFYKLEITDPNKAYSVSNLEKEASQRGNSTVFYKEYSIAMIPISQGWYFTAISGLPNKTVEVMYVLSAQITSKVRYALYIENNYVTEEGYTVKEKEYLQLPPVVYAMDYNILNDISILEETLGLGPKGWAINKNTSFKSLIVAFDDKGINTSEIKFKYRVNDGLWSEAPVNEEPLFWILKDTVNYLNTGVISQINGLLEGYATIPKIEVPIFIGHTNISGQQVGSYVEFYANVMDVGGNTFSSPVGFYYVVNKTSNTKILTIDPNFYLWLLQENLEHFVDVVKQNNDYQIPESVTKGFTNAKYLADLIRKYGIAPFRHWEYLGESYDLYIAKVDKNIPDLLGSFQPNVIFLSNVWNGFRQTGAPWAGFWDWDLRDLGVDDDIINYVKNNHAGLIATHGTLSDWIVWTGQEDSEKYKVCTRGHVGYGMDDIDIQEKTIAHMLGLPTLALYEYVRDEVAKALCKGEYTYPLGLLVGSTPLQVPYIPFNGTLRKTPEANYSDWIIPEEFYIEIPGIYQEVNFTRKNLTAHTQIGWQLGMPRALAYAAWWEAQELRPYAQELYKNLSQLIQNITERWVKDRNITDRLDDSLVWALRNTYKSLISANIIGEGTFNLTFNVSDVNATIKEIVNLTIYLVSRVYETILQHLPVRLIALSKDGLAGIIAKDKYWDENGYRSVYFSFEIEVAKGTVAKDLLKQAVEWSKDWEYKNITELLGGVRVGKDVSEKFRENVTTALGTQLAKTSLILNEEGVTTLDLNLQNKSISTILVVHPTADSITAEVVNGNAEIMSIQNLNICLTKIKMKSHTTGKITVGFRASSESSLNPIHVVVKENRAPQITSYDPVTNPTVNEAESQTFTVETLDPDNDILTIDWKLNGLLVATGTSYTFSSNYTSAGSYTVNITVTDGEFFIYREWILTVNDVDTMQITPTGADITFGNVAIEIPAGASTVATTIITKEITITPPKGCKVIGKVYRIESTIATFAKPVRLTLSYNETDLPEGANESELAIWRKTGDKWERLGGEVDIVKNTVTVETTSFSEYAIFYGEPVEEALLPAGYLLIVGIIVLIAIVGGVITAAIRRKKR